MICISHFKRFVDGQILICCIVQSWYQIKTAGFNFVMLSWYLCWRQPARTKIIRSRMRRKPKWCTQSKINYYGSSIKYAELGLNRPISPWFLPSFLVISIYTGMHIIHRRAEDRSHKTSVAPPPGHRGCNHVQGPTILDFISPNYTRFTQKFSGYFCNIIT